MKMTGYTTRLNAATLAGWLLCTCLILALPSWSQTRDFTLHDRTNLWLVSSNILRSNILAGSGITITVGAKGQLTLSGGGTNFDQIIVTNRINGSASNQTDLFTASIPARAAYIGTNDSRDVRTQRLVVTNDLVFGENGEFGFHFSSDDDGYLYVSNNFIGGLYFTLDAATTTMSFAGTVSAGGLAVSGSSSIQNIGYPSHNQYVIGTAAIRAKDIWTANTLNTTGFVAGITYAPALVNGSYTNATNNLLVMIPNGSTRTQWLNSACAVGALQGAFDRLGTASGTNIYVKATAGNVHTGTVDVISTAFGSKTFQWDGTNWWRIWQN